MRYRYDVESIASETSELSITQRNMEKAGWEPRHTWTPAGQRRPPVGLYLDTCLAIVISQTGTDLIGPVPVRSGRIMNEGCCLFFLLSFPPSAHQTRASKPPSVGNLLGLLGSADVQASLRSRSKTSGPFERIVLAIHATSRFLNRSLRQSTGSCHSPSF